MHHDSSDGEAHVPVLRPVITEPSGAPFSETGKCTSLNNHSSLAFVLEPIVGSMHFQSAKEGVSFKLRNYLLDTFNLHLGMDCIQGDTLCL